MNYHTARIFEHYGLDYAFNGQKSIEQACKEKCINPYEVAAELSQFIEKYNASPKMFDLLDLDNLIDYIVNNHHTFCKSRLPDIIRIIEKQLAGNNEENYILVKVKQLVNKISELIQINYIREEKTLFPIIKTLVDLKRNNKKIGNGKTGKFDTIKTPIEVILKEHSKLGQILGQVRRVTCNFTLTESQATSYEEIYNDLIEFEKDVFMHVHLENNILFPKTLSLEQELRTVN